MLSDATNILPAKRASKEKAVSEIACITAKKAPRGGKHVPEATCLTHAQAKSSGPRDSLCQIARHNHTVYNKGKECLEEYIAKNAAFDTQKAFALQVLATAMSTWGKGIVEAATLASQVCGFSAEIGAFPGPPENIDNEFIYHELSSDRGH